MRVLHVVTQSVFGGATRVVRGLAEDTVAAGYESAVAFGMQGDGAAWHGMADEVRRYPLPSMVREIHPANDIRAARHLRRVHQEWQPDILHLHTSKAAALGRLTPGMAAGRIVYTMHGYEQLLESNRLLLPVDWMLRRRSGAIVAVAERDLVLMVRDGYRARLIVNGTAEPRSAGDRSDIADEVAVLRRVRDAGLPVVMMIARDAPPKRGDLARAAAGALHGRAVVVWIGGVPSPNDPPNFIAMHVPDAPRVLEFADIFMLLSDHEGMPLAVLEAMAAGLPCVVSAPAAAAEVLGDVEARDAATGLVVDNEVGAIRAALLHLLDDEQLRLAMGRRARQRWQAVFSQERMSQAYLRLYRELHARADRGTAAIGAGSDRRSAGPTPALPGPRRPQSLPARQ